MKPTLVADEMFPEGAGPYVELEEVIQVTTSLRSLYHSRKQWYEARDNDKVTADTCLFGRIVDCYSYIVYLRS